jgi:hypothetical protein
MTMVTISGDQVVIFAKHADGTHGTGFLAIVKMAEPANLLVLVKISSTLFKSSNQIHLTEPAYSFFSIHDRSGSGLYLGHDLSSLLVLLARLCIRTDGLHTGA